MKAHTSEYISPLVPEGLTTYIIGESLEEQQQRITEQAIAQELDIYEQQRDFPDRHLRAIADLALRHSDEDTGEIPVVLIKAAEEAGNDVLAMEPKNAGTQTVFALGLAYDVTHNLEMIKKAQTIIEENPQMNTPINTPLLRAIGHASIGDVSFTEAHKRSFLEARRNNRIHSRSA